MKLPFALIVLLTISLSAASGGLSRQLAGPPGGPPLDETAYPGTEWRTIYGAVEAIDRYCRGALGNPGEGAKWTGCILPGRKVIAVSSLETCLHEAVHAADREWGNTPQHRLWFRATSEDEEDG